jgi:ribose transport system substrate-binding protein
MQDDSFEAMASSITRRRLLVRGAQYASVLGLGSTALAACGSDDDAASSGGGSSAASQTSNAAIKELQARLDAAKAMPKFAPPGPAFDASGARGKTVFYLSLDNAIPIVRVLVDSVTEAAKAAGVELVVYDGKSQPAQFNAGMEQAIARKVDCILIESVATASLERPIKKAVAAGIKVVSLNELEPIPDVDGSVVFDYLGAAQLEADWVIVDSGGKNINSVTWIAPFPTHLAMRDTIQQEFTKYAPDAKVQVEQVEFGDWQTRTPSLVRSKMQRDPDINYFIPVVDGQSLFMVPALQQAGYADKVKISTFNATQGVLQLLQKENVVGADSGQDTLYAGYADIDQALRVLTDQQPAQAKVPNRLFDITNINDVDLGDPLSWFDLEGTRNGFRETWGV